MLWLTGVIDFEIISAMHFSGDFSVLVLHLFKTFFFPDLLNNYISLCTNIAFSKNTDACNMTK